MAETLILKCDCGEIDCGLSLEITPLNSISIFSWNDWLGGLHLSIDDTKKLINKLQENIKTAEEIKIEAERILHKTSLLGDNHEKNNL